jgi:hypothetical protein
MFIFKDNKYKRYIKDAPGHYIGENKELYTGSKEQRMWIKDNISKNVIWVNGEWQLHSISVGVEHPLFDEIKELFDKYKETHNN